MDKEIHKKKDSAADKSKAYPKIEGNFSWDNFDLDKFFRDFDKVGKIIKEQKKEDARRFIQE